jgi:hypothetical protein
VPAFAQPAPNCRVDVTPSINAPIPRSGFVRWVDSSRARSVR